MTDVQKRKITAMRAAGIGYKKISAELGVSRDSVRYFCKIAGLDGEAVTVDDGGPLFCEHCGSVITKSPRGRARRFCSGECRRAWWSAHPEARSPKPDAVYSFVCAGCGRAFESYGNKNRCYCTHGCYIKYRFGG